MLPLKGTTCLQSQLHHQMNADDDDDDMVVMMMTMMGLHHALLTANEPPTSASHVKHVVPVYEWLCVTGDIPLCSERCQLEGMPVRGGAS